MNVEEQEKELTRRLDIAIGALNDILAATHPYGIPKSTRWICDKASEALSKITGEKNGRNRVEGSPSSAEP
jgi:hypothetical protein